MAGEKQIKKAAESVGSKAGAKMDMEAEKKFNDMLMNDFVPQNALGLSDAMIEGMYGQAYRLYNSGKYAQARETFKFLVMVNSTEPKYLMGLGACYHMLKQYEGAIQTYMICGMLDPNNPVPHYHMSDCSIQLKDLGGAIISLEMAIQRAGVKPEYQALKDRAALTIESLKNEMKKEEDEKKKVREKHKKDS
jgi:type III secretion system low calcium response chaperone LcrH/SycD